MHEIYWLPVIDQLAAASALHARLKLYRLDDESKLDIIQGLQ